MLLLVYSNKNNNNINNYDNNRSDSHNYNIKEEKECIIIDIDLQADQNIEIKETETIEKYRELATEITRMWRPATYSSWSAWRVLGAISIQFKGDFELLKKLAILGTARILRKVLRA